MNIHAKLLIVQKEDGTEGMQTNFPCWLTEYCFGAGRGFLDSTSIHSGSLPRGRQCALQTLTPLALPLTQASLIFPFSSEGLNPSSFLPPTILPPSPHARERELVRRMSQLPGR